MGDFNTDTDKATGCAFTKLFESFFVVVLRVRIQACDHASDGVADQLLLVHRLDVVALDHTKYGGELLQLFKGQGRHVGARNGLNRHGCEHTCQAAYGDPSSDFEFLAHEFFVVEHQLVLNIQLWALRCGERVSRVVAQIVVANRFEFGVKLVDQGCAIRNVDPHDRVVRDVV